MKDYKILYFGLGIAAVLLYLKYMKDKPLKKEDIANKNVTPTTPMTSTTSTGGIVATTTEIIKEAFGQGAMTIQDIAKNKGNSGGGGYSRKPQDVPLREYKNTGVANPKLDIIYNADGSSSTLKKSFTSIDQACKCADNTTTNQLNILKNFNR
jgi:hypothetical protein